MAYHSFPRWLPGGFLGVDLFLVLSGFLITVLLVTEHRQTGSIHLGRFYARRALRLFPALFVMLAICCAVASLRLNPLRARTIHQAAVVTLCYGANFDWLLHVPLDLFGHAWSLSLEEQFYLVWPLILSILLRFRVTLGTIGMVVLAGILASAIFRACLWLSASSSTAQIQAATTSLACRADSLLVGCLVGLLSVAGKLPVTPSGRMSLQTVVAASAILLLGLTIVAETRNACLYLGGYTLVAMLTAQVIASLISAPGSMIARVLRAPALVRSGRMSYGLYLWHFPLLSLTPKLLHGVLPISRQVSGLKELAAFLSAVGAASLSYRWVEGPCLRLKRRLKTATTIAQSQPTSPISPEHGYSLPASANFSTCLFSPARLAKDLRSR
jgi:peptidoglycan/LPS O-acetylase OafA/YrhL